MEPKDIKNNLSFNFTPLVGIANMKVYLLDGDNIPINPKRVSNGLIMCEDGWKYKINIKEVSCREGLINNIRTALKYEDTDKCTLARYAVATHPPVLGNNMPKDFILYPTKAVPYLQLGNFETKSDLFHTNPEIMGKWADLLIGIISVILDRSEATKRAFKERYLEPGLFESIKERGSGYIFEYHSLSSYWGKCPELISLITSHMRIAARLSLAELTKEKFVEVFWAKTDYDEVRDTIQSYDFERALDIYNKIKPCLVWASGESDPMTDSKLGFIEYVIMKGIDNIWPDININKNFEGDSNGWFTGLCRRRFELTKFFNQRMPSLNSVIMSEDIKFLDR